MILILLAGLASCNSTKFVPEGRYLLDKAKVEVTDTKDLSPTELRAYVRQKQNTEIFGFWKLQLHIYNTAPTDTTTKSKKRLARNAHKLGEMPEIYDEELTMVSMQQLKKAVNNLGYYQCRVDTAKVIKKQKIRLTYRITAGEPYFLGEVHCDFPQKDLQRAATNERRTLLKEGDHFDVNVLDQERQRIVSDMRNHGYYYLQKDMLRVLADSTEEAQRINVELRLQNSIEQLPDSDFNHLFHPYSIRKVCFHMDYDPQLVSDSIALHSMEKDGYEVTWFGKRLLRPNALKRNCAIHPGDLYSERRVEMTYDWLNQLGVVKYVDIIFEEVSKDELDCHIVMSRSKLNSFSAEAEGTYSSGDWGVSAGVGYINKNIFHGAEELQLGVHGSYEWRQNGGRAIEAQATAGLTFANRLKITASYQYQTRPDEFTRTIVNAALGYTLRRRTGWTHAFQFLDVAYVNIPWMSDEFSERFVNNRNPLKYSYTSHFIDALSYSGQYSGFRKNKPLHSYAQARFFVETAGNVVYGVEKAFDMPKPDGVYKIGNVPFSQYTKMDAGFTYTHVLKEHHCLAYHAAVGVAVPYGNSESVPYEKRYFAGGSNHVRGWTSRSLGPGAYKGEGSRIDYEAQTGDIHLDLSLEYRWRVWSIFELAAFSDAGNIWTIREYDSQPHGAFHWNQFYKEIAWSYGVGLRLDFSFLIFRIDFGVKLYDPSRLYDDGRMWRTVPNGLCWKDDMTFHFAIGYPF